MFAGKSWGELRGGWGLLLIHGWVERAGFRRADAVGPGLECHRSMSRPTVLIVDDEPLSRWSAAETLADAGYRVVEAGDAASALRAMSACDSPADVVLLDLLLPDAADLNVLSAIHKLAPQTSIILMTSFGSPELFDEAHELGAFMSVHKPFEMSELPRLVARALSARRELKPDDGCHAHSVSR